MMTAKPAPSSVLDIEVIWKKVSLISKQVNIYIAHDYILFVCSKQ
jgi:hypothetical protein